RFKIGNQLITHFHGSEHVVTHLHNVHPFRQGPCIGICGGDLSFNVLTAVEMRNKLITNFKADNKNDTYALSQLALHARTVLQKQDGEKLWALADKGFDTGCELQACAGNDILTLVSPKKRAFHSKSKQFDKDAFEFDHAQNHYTCPAGLHLTTNGNWYTKNNGKHRRAYKVQHYKLPFHVCNACPHRIECAGKANLNNSKGRYIERNQYETYIEDNIERVKLNKEFYRKRQEIVEHPFGTIKRQWGFDYTLLKGKQKVSGEFGIIFTCYNLRRAMSIIGISELIKRFRAICELVNTLLGAILSPAAKFLSTSCKYTVRNFANFKSGSRQLYASETNSICESWFFPRLPFGTIN
ncbi:MAG: transposase, partial [Bacteroidota bacterium]